MTARPVTASTPDGHRVHQVACRPLYQVAHLGGDRWCSDGDDPQLFLDWPDDVGAGPCRITLRVAGADAAGPVVYLDFGDGWSEATRVPCGAAGDGRWVATTWLPSAPRAMRVDPVARAGAFGFGRVRIERLGEGEAILAALAGADAGVGARDAHAVALQDGVAAAWRLLTQGAPAERADGSRYDAWIAAFDTLSTDALHAARRYVASLAERPLLTLVLPLVGVGDDDVERCLAALVAQVYPDWELVLVDAAGVPESRRQLARAFAARHSRATLQPRADRGASAALRDALASARGRFAGILEGAPLLAPHALLAFADVVLAGTARVVYADHDLVDASGRRTDPYLKPDWNPDLFLAQDYLGPLVMYEASLLEAVGGVDPDAGEAAIVDLCLRCVSAAAPGTIAHIPLVLQHARRHRLQRTGAEASRALDAHLRAHGAGVEAVATAAGHDIRWPLPGPPPRISLVIPTRDRVDLLRRCVDSICTLTTYPDYEVLVVDNQSVEPETLDYLAALRDRPGVRVLAHDAPFNYSAINNAAVAQATGAIVGLVNNDIEVVSPDWLERLVQHAVRPDVGAVGAMLLYPDDTIQHAGVVVGLGGVAGHPYLGMPRGAAGQHGRARLAQDMTAVTGACLLLRRELYDQVGGLDERLSVAFNDIDLCLRLRALGLRNVWTPSAVLYHHESASRGAEDTPAKRARFEGEVDYMMKTWPEALAHDPAYHPGLSLLHDDAFALGFPPRQASAAWLQALATGRAQ